MRQAIAKMSRFIIHIICRIFCKDGNSERRTHCNFDDNSRSSTDAAAEAKEPLITAIHDFHVNDNSSCSTDVAIEAKEPLITTTHDFHVISIQTLDDNSSCSTDVAAEAKEPLIATTHEFQVISVQTLNDNSSCSSNVAAESKETLTATTHDSHVITIQTLDDTSSCSSVVAESEEPLITTTHDLHAISILVEDKGHYRPKNGYCNCSNSSGNGKKNAKEKEIKAVRIPKQPQVKREGKWLRHYCSNHRILLVGEGDFSFSACLAKAFGSALNMVATSLDSLDFLERNYPSAKTNIGCLRNRGAIVLHNLDATNMKLNICVNGYIYDRIIYNFPLAGFFNETKKQQLKRNRKLVRSFMENARNLLASDGEIHIRHKTSPIYQEWGLENLAKQCRLRLIEDVEFNLSHYPGYHNKYGFGGNDNFHCYPSRTYKFGLKKTL